MLVKIYSTSNEKGLNEIMENTSNFRSFNPLQESVGYSFEVKTRKELISFTTKLKKISTDDIKFRVVLDGLTFNEFNNLSKAISKPDSDFMSFTKCMIKPFDSFIKAMEKIPDSALGVSNEDVAEGTGT